MNLPKRCGKLYIKFDEDKNPEYGFLFSENRLKKFIPLSDKNFDTIILPRLVGNQKYRVYGFNNINPTYCGLFHKDYVEGGMKICDGCFSGVKKAKIVVPFENSVMLDWGCFDEDAEIEFVLHKNLALKQVYRNFDTGFDYEHENWTIIGDATIMANFEVGGFTRDQYVVMNYNEEDLDYKLANLSFTNVLFTNTSEDCFNFESVEEINK